MCPWMFFVKNVKIIKIGIRPAGGILVGFIPFSIAIQTFTVRRHSDTTYNWSANIRLGGNVISWTFLVCQLGPLQFSFLAFERFSVLIFQHSSFLVWDLQMVIKQTSYFRVICCFSKTWFDIISWKPACIYKLVLYGRIVV